MKFKLEYKNDNPPFVGEVPEALGWGEPIVHLSVEGSTKGRTRRESLTDILVNTECLFRDLKNMHDTDIKKMELTVKNRGTFLKEDNEVNPTLQAQFNKYDMIVYSFYSDVFSEKLLLTRNNANENEKVTRNGSGLTFEGNVINEEMFSIGNRVKSRAFMDSLLVSVHKFLPDYEIRLDPKSKTVNYAYKGSILNSIEDIADDDVFIFFKFVEVLLTKGTHFGIFFIDCTLFRPNVLAALVSLINLNYLNNRLIFLYNLTKEMEHKMGKIQIETVTFPNHKIPYADKVKKK